VYKGQAVIDAYGVVGQVSNVGPVSAEVILLSDNSHSIPVQISRNDLRTIATGSGDPRHLALNFLPRAADVKVDDVLLTSGLGGVFPAGYPVGRVAEVRRDPSQPLSTITVEPYAHLDRDQEVLLVWYDQPPEPPAPAEAPKPAPGKHRGPLPAVLAPAPTAATPAPGATPPAAAGKPEAPARADSVPKQDVGPKSDATAKPDAAAKPAPARTAPAPAPGKPAGTNP
jgi:rod shape-determining protein MreC